MGIGGTGIRRRGRNTADESAFSPDYQSFSQVTAAVNSHRKAQPKQPRATTSNRRSNGGTTNVREVEPTRVVWSTQDGTVELSRREQEMLAQHQGPLPRPSTFPGLSAFNSQAANDGGADDDYEGPNFPLMEAMDTDWSGGVEGMALEIIEQAREGWYIERSQPGLLKAHRREENWRRNVEAMKRAFLEHEYRQAEAGSGLGSEAVEKTVTVIDMYRGIETRKIKIRGDGKPTGDLLMKQGYVGSAPINPSYVATIDTLKWYSASQKVTATAMLGFIRTLAYRHMSYHRWGTYNAFRRIWSIWSVVQLEIRNDVETALGRDGEAYRLRTACPACMYSLADETSLDPQMIVSLDGNNSLKRFEHAGRGAEGAVAYTPRHLLPPEQVDRYADEVKRGRAEGESTKCESNFEAAKEKSGAPAGMYETGLFTCVCRHAVFLKGTDMIKSGERAKYPLAIIHHLVLTLPLVGRLGVLYDIGCSFSSTLRNSSMKADFVKVTSGTDTFHGYAHARPCQVQFFPRYLPGFGLTDGEGNEQLYGIAINRLAGAVRSAAKATRHARIDSTLDRWNEEKVANLGTFLLSRIKEAEQKLLGSRAQLEKAERQGLSRATLASYWEKERAWMKKAGMKEEEIKESAEEAYVEGLQTRAKLDADVKALHMKVNSAAYHHLPPAEQHKIRLQFNRYFSRLQYLEENLDRAADILQLPNRGSDEAPQIHWDLKGPDVHRVKLESSTRTYRRRLRDLQVLVISRLFEIGRLGVSNLCYKLRSSISQHISKRTGAIVTAVASVNEEGQKIGGTVPFVPLVASKILEAGFVGDCDFLSPVVDGAPWTERPIRAYMEAYMVERRAIEELERCAIEIRRMYTWLRDEFDSLRLCSANISASSTASTYERLIGLEIERLTVWHDRTTSHIRIDLDRADSLLTTIITNCEVPVARSKSRFGTAKAPPSPWPEHGWVYGPGGYAVHPQLPELPMAAPFVGDHDGGEDDGFHEAVGEGFGVGEEDGDEAETLGTAMTAVEALSS